MVTNVCVVVDNLVALAVESACVRANHRLRVVKVDVGCQISLQVCLAAIHSFCKGDEVVEGFYLHASLDGSCTANLHEVPASGIAVAEHVGILVTVVAHFLLGEAVASAVTAKIALHVEGVFRIVVGHVEVAFAVSKVGQGVADRRVGEDDVVLAGVHVADVPAVLLIEESPLVAFLLGSPDKAVGLLVEVAPIDIVLAPFCGEVVLLECHCLGLGGAGAVELAAVTDDVELVTFLYLAYVGNPGIGNRKLHRSHLFVGERRLPEGHFADVGVGCLTVIVT